MDGTLEDEELMEHGNHSDDGYVGGEDIRTRTNEKQLSHLVELMEDHFALASGRSGGTNYAKMQESGWKNVAESLNRLGPPTRDWKGWRKVWNNQTNETRKKVRLAEKYQRDTGGGPFRGAQLTLLQKRIDRFMQISASVCGREGLRFGVGGTTANPENLYRPSEANAQVPSQQSQPGTSQARHLPSSQRWSEAFEASQPEECENNRPGTSQAHPVAVTQRDRPGTSQARHLPSSQRWSETFEASQPEECENNQPGTSQAHPVGVSQRDRPGTSQARHLPSSQRCSETFEASQPEECENNRPGTSQAHPVGVSQRDRPGTSQVHPVGVSQRDQPGTSQARQPVVRRRQPPGAQRRCATAFDVDQPEALFMDSQAGTSESNQPELPEVNQSETSGLNQHNPRQSYASRNLQYATRSNPRQYRTQRNSLMELFVNRIRSAEENNANQQTILNSLVEMQEQRVQIQREQLEVEKKRLEADKENIRLQKAQLDILCKILQNQSGPPGSSDRA